MIIIPTKDIAMIEYKIRPMLDKAFNNTSDPQIDNADHWIKLLKSGAAFCFMSKNLECFCLCSKVNEIFYLHVIAGANFKSHAANGIKYISSFAKFSGCNIIVSTARLGAAKQLELAGFKEVKYRKRHKTVMKVIGDSQTSSAGR